MLLKYSGTVKLEKLCQNNSWYGKCRLYLNFMLRDEQCVWALCFHHTGSTKQFCWIAILDVHWIAAHLLPLLLGLLSASAELFTLWSCRDQVRAVLKLWVGSMKKSENRPPFMPHFLKRDAFFIMTRFTFAYWTAITVFTFLTTITHFEPVINLLL